MWKLWAFLRPYRTAAVLAPLLMVLEVCMDLLQPKLMAAIVDGGVTQGNLPYVWETGAWMIVVAFIGLIGGAGCTLYANKASQGFGTDLRGSLFHKVQMFSFRQLDHFHTGSLITRMTGDVMQLQNLVQMSLRVLVRSGSLLIGSTVMAFMISPRLAAVLLFVIPLLFIILYTLMHRSNPLFAGQQKKLDRVNTVLQENTAGIRLVKAFVRGDYERKRFGIANSDYLDMGLKAARTVALNMPLMTLVLNTSIVAVLWYGGAQTWNNGLPIGDLAAFISYMVQILFSLISFGTLLMNIARAKASAERIQEVLEEEPDMTDPDPEDAERSVIRSGRIEFDRVCFSYNANPSDSVLENISFFVEAGQTVGILGATGSGKSTLVSLIPRLYEVTSGSVRIDGHDVREFDSSRLRSQIGMVLQQTVLFSGTIRENISFGKPEATDEEIRAAAQSAEAHEFISRLADGYDAVLGQRGINLSGGQKQRIAIARALVMRPRILILDDSTSAVDLGTESRMQRQLRELMKNSTCIIIAQRISSVTHADQIIVLDNGRISAAGTHRELMENSPVYQDIYRSQRRKEELLHG